MSTALASTHRQKPALAAALLLLSLLLLPFASLRSADNALRPAEITPEQSGQAPYRDSGQLSVLQGQKYYIGTASYIRRYTGLTAGHMLFAPKTGLSTGVNYAADLYIESSYYVKPSYFAVLGGYQAVTTTEGNDSDDAFNQDMGYLLFSRPAPNDEWAAWSDDPTRLLTNGPFLALGYAAESFDGDELAFVRHTTPYYQVVAPGFYNNRAYYTEGGMSGGPLYVAAPDGSMVVAAINVAGTSYSDPAYSGARAITPAESALFRAAEYDHGVITGGTLTGPATVKLGGTVKFKTGLTFYDHTQETVKYDGDVKLVVKGSYKHTVVVNKVKAGKYSVTFPASIPGGTQIPLCLLRTDLPQKAQAPLQTLIVTVDR